MKPQFELEFVAHCSAENCMDYLTNVPTSRGEAVKTLGIAKHTVRGMGEYS